MKWPAVLIIPEARNMQDDLRKQIRIAPLTNKPRFIAGADAAFSDEQVFAAACLYSFPELTLIEKKTAAAKLAFPYVPGFLALREGPAIIAALRKLSTKPDLILVDGQGIAHPRGAGIASYIGVLTGIPSIGCAKSRLIGEHGEPGPKKGDRTPLLHDGVVIGAVVRTRDHTRPLFVSDGHMVDLDDAIRYTLACTGGFRIPEPLRCADMVSRMMKRQTLAMVSALR